VCCNAFSATCSAIAAPPRRATIRTNLLNWGTDSPVNTGTHSGLFTLITCSTA
jgi:hypothetical protein